MQGALGRFLSCYVGRQFFPHEASGWDQCSHGVASIPSKPVTISALKAVCGLLGYPAGAAAELLDGSLKLRYCTTLFTRRFLPWALPGTGGVVPCGSLSNGGGDGKSDPRDGARIAVKRGSGYPGRRIPGTCQAGSRASNAKAMGKVASSRILRIRD